MDVVSAIIRNPIAAMKAFIATKGPRMCSLSEASAHAIIARKQNTKGGAVRPWDWTSEKEPISSMIVGRKTGSEAKLTLHPKYIREVM